MLELAPSTCDPGKDLANIELLEVLHISLSTAVVPVVVQVGDECRDGVDMEARVDLAEDRDLDVGSDRKGGCDVSEDVWKNA